MARHLDELTQAGTPWGECPEIDPHAVLRRVEAALEVSPAERKSPMTRKLRFPLALCAALALLTVTALAFAPSLRELIAASLGSKAPYAVEALGSCEDMGITIEAQSALTDGRVTRLYFTVHDPSGVFFLEDTDNDLFVEPVTENGEGSNGGTGLEQVSYDPEAQTGLYVYSRGLYPDHIEPIVEAKLTMSLLIPGRRDGNPHFRGPGNPKGYPSEVPGEVLESAYENGAIVLLPEQTPLPFDEDCPEVTFSSMGFASDGYYHIRLSQEPYIVMSYSNDPADRPFTVHYLMFDRERPNVGPRDFWEDAVYTAVPGGWDICLTSLPKEDFDLLALLTVDATYSVSGGIQEGKWELTVPVEQVAARAAQPAETLILSRTKDSPPPSGRNDEAQVAAVSVSPLSVAVDFVTPEGYEYPASINGSETACAVTLKDGTVLEPTYYSETWGGRKGWVMWEFGGAIDPEQVTAVTLNGNPVSFS